MICGGTAFRLFVRLSVIYSFLDVERDLGSDCMAGMAAATLLGGCKDTLNMKWHCKQGR